MESSHQNVQSSLQTRYRLRLGMSVILVIAAFSLSFFLSGCEESDADKLADAQECLDAYARNGGGDLSVCERYVEGMTTPAAYGIRCASGFIREGFTSAQRYIDAFEQIETINSNSVRAFLALVSFTSAGTGNTTNVNSNYTNAGRVYGYCASSLAKGATMISTFSYITNVLFKYACDVGADCAMNDTSLQSALVAAVLDNMGSGNSLKSDLGTIVVNTNTVSCSTGASNQKLCEFMQTAIDNAGGPNNKIAVGEEFLQVLANPPP